MTQTTFRVQGIYASGRYVSHLVGACDIQTAIDSVLNADDRILRITKITPVHL